MPYSLLKTSAAATNLAIMLTPEHNHLWLQNLYHISIEWENMHLHVHDPMAKMVRMQWWRDQIEAFINNNTPVEHPSLKALASGTKPDLSPLLAVIEAHEEVLEQPIIDDDRFFDFLIRTTSPFIALACNHLDICYSEAFLQAYSLGTGIFKKIGTLNQQLTSSRFLLPSRYIDAILLDKSSLQAQKLGLFGQSYTKFLAQRAYTALIEAENALAYMSASSLLFKVELDVAKTYHRALSVANYDPIFSGVKYDRPLKHPIGLLKIVAKAWWWSRTHTPMTSSLQ